MGRSALPFQQLAPELHSAITTQAEADAVRVHYFLQRNGLHEIKLPQAEFRDFMLALAAIVRLENWENDSIWIHVEHGFPSSAVAFLEFKRALGELDSEKLRRCADLSRKLVALFAERFAWSGKDDLGADFQLSDVSDDCFIDALAEFLWQQRHCLSS